MKILILLFVALVCAYVGKKAGDKASGFLADVVVWYVITPLYTTVILHIVYFFLYRFDVKIFFMSFPLLVPIGWGVFMLVTTLNDRRVYNFHTPKIRELAIKLFPTEEKAIEAYVSYESKDFKSFISKKPKELTIRVYVAVPNAIKETTEKTILDQFEKDMEKNLRQTFHSVTVFIR